MTPKEKADKIFRKFLLDVVSEIGITDEAYELQKKFSNIVVDEVIDELSDLPRIPYNERREKYWREVKFELEKF